jgi:hypothetical protein
MAQDTISERPAFDDKGDITRVEEFDYDLVERRLSEDLSNPELREELAGLTPAEMEAGLKLFRCLVRWMWQDGMKNANGLTIRAIIVCWIFIEELAPMSLTQMARGFDGRDKQSLGRWMDNFKEMFGMIRTPHMRFKSASSKTKPCKA